MSVRTYRQHCGLAYALDVVGERWSLLVLRELLAGPRRYKHLLAGLPGIGTGMLAARLKALEEQGIVRRTTLPPPADAQVYELTDLGRQLEPVLIGLTRFGLHWMGARRKGDVYRPEWLALGMRARADPEAARGLHEAYELRVADGRVFSVRVDDGDVEVVEEAADDPVVTLSGDLDSLLEMFEDGTDARELVAAGRLQVEGDRKALARWGRIMQR